MKEVTNEEQYIQSLRDGIAADKAWLEKNSMAKEHTKPKNGPWVTTPKPGKSVPYEDDYGERKYLIGV